ncbi:hypothetical protein BJ912DRAFT_600860 [Pholiota molesta]|nr:hypothetical protein BJ912DRAFT_600860 [Pholiota molesta]
MQDIELLARGMILQAGNDLDPIRALQLAVDAGKILERALPGLEDLSTTDISASALSPGDWAVISSSGTVIVSDDTHFTYASSLLRIAQIQLTHRQSVASNKYAKTGLAILNHLLAKYPGSDKIQDEITRALTHLSGMTIRTLNTDAENLQYTERNTALFRQLGQINPQRYVIPLALALWSQRDVFLILGDADKAQRIYQEMVSLSALAAAPPHLDLQIPSQTEGDYYAQVALAHHTTTRFTDAIYAAQNAISQYAALEFMEPGRSRAKHISVVTTLTSLKLSCWET